MGDELSLKITLDDKQAIQSLDGLAKAITGLAGKTKLPKLTVPKIDTTNLKEFRDLAALARQRTISVGRQLDDLNKKYGEGSKEANAFVSSQKKLNNVAKIQRQASISLKNALKDGAITTARYRVEVDKLRATQQLFNNKLNMSTPIRSMQGNLSGLAGSIGLIDGRLSTLVRSFDSFLNFMSGMTFDLPVEGMDQGSEKFNIFRAAAVKAKTAVSSINPAIVAAVATIGTLTAAIVTIRKEVNQTVEAFAEYEERLNKLSALGGFNADEKGELSAQIESLAARTEEFNAADLAKGMIQLQKAGISGAEGIQILATNTEVAVAVGQDLEATNRQSIDALKALNKETSEARTVYNQFAAVANASKAEFGDFSEVLAGVGARLSDLKQPSSEVAALIGLIKEKGLETSTVMTQLRQVTKVLLDPTKEQGDLFNKLGISILDTQGNAKSLVSVFSELKERTKDLTDGQRVQLLTKLFGERGSNAASIIVRGLDGDLQKLIETAESAGKNDPLSEMVSKMRKGVVSARKALDSIKSTIDIKIGARITGQAELETGIRSIRSTLAGLLNDGLFNTYADTIGNFIKPLQRIKAPLVELGTLLKVGFINSLAFLAPMFNDFMKVLDAGVRTLNNFITPIVYIISSSAEASNSLDSLLPSVETLENLFSTLAGTMLGLPFGPLGAIIGAFAGSFLALAPNADEAKDRVVNAVEEIKSVLGDSEGFYQDILQKVRSGSELTADEVVSVWDSGALSFKERASFILKGLMVDTDNTIKFILNEISIAFLTIRQKIEGAFNFAKQILSIINSLLGTSLSSMLKPIKTFFDFINKGFTFLKKEIKNFLKMFTGAFKASRMAFKASQQAIKNIWKSITSQKSPVKLKAKIEPLDKEMSKLLKQRGDYLSSLLNKSLASIKGASSGNLSTLSAPETLPTSGSGSDLLSDLDPKKPSSSKQADLASRMRALELSKLEQSQQLAVNDLNKEYLEILQQAAALEKEQVENGAKLDKEIKLLELSNKQIRAAERRGMLTKEQAQSQLQANKHLLAAKKEEKALLSLSIEKNKILQDEIEKRRLSLELTNKKQLLLKEIELTSEARDKATGQAEIADLSKKLSDLNTKLANLETQSEQKITKLSNSIDLKKAKLKAKVESIKTNRQIEDQSIDLDIEGQLERGGNRVERNILQGAKSTYDSIFSAFQDGKVTLEEVISSVQKIFDQLSRGGSSGGGFGLLGALTGGFGGSNTSTKYDPSTLQRGSDKVFTAFNTLTKQTESLNTSCGKAAKAAVGLGGDLGGLGGLFKGLQSGGLKEGLTGFLSGGLGGVFAGASTVLGIGSSIAGMFSSKRKARREAFRKAEIARINNIASEVLRGVESAENALKDRLKDFEKGLRRIDDEIDLIKEEASRIDINTSLFFAQKSIDASKKQIDLIAKKIEQTSKVLGRGVKLKITESTFNAYWQGMQVLITSAEGLGAEATGLFAERNRQINALFQARQRISRNIPKDGAIEKAALQQIDNISKQIIQVNKTFNDRIDSMANSRNELQKSLRKANIDLEQAIEQQKAILVKWKNKTARAVAEIQFGTIGGTLFDSMNGALDQIREVLTAGLDPSVTRFLISNIKNKAMNQMKNDYREFLEGGINNYIDSVLAISNDLTSILNENRITGTIKETQEDRLAAIQGRLDKVKKERESNEAEQSLAQFGIKLDGASSAIESFTDKLGSGLDSLLRSFQQGIFTETGNVNINTIFDPRLVAREVQRNIKEGSDINVNTSVLAI